jgi:hypothetical protein
VTASAWHQFFFIMGLGLVTAGLTTYVITWMLVAVHLRDHHGAERQRIGGFLFAPRAIGWYLAARWRRLRDPGLSALAVLGSIGAWAIVLGAIGAAGARLIAGGGS